MASGVVAPSAIPTAETRRPPVAVAIRGDRWATVARWLTWGAFGVILALAALAPIVRTGDAHQYYAMATALADLRPPALTGEEVERFKAWLQAQPDDAGFASSVRAVDQPSLIAGGRQEFSHFWLYPLLVAPVIALTNLVALHPGYAFLAVNAALLGCALWQVQRAYSAVASLLILASPLIWFVNKAQVEVFTVSFLCIAMAQARRGRWLGAGLAAAIAATQNAPILAAVACFWGAALLRQLLVRQRQPITPRGVALVLMTIVIGALHPAYYLWRLGVLTPQRLNGGINLRLPPSEQYVAVLVDPDIGFLPWLPLYGLAALIGLALVWRLDHAAPPTPQSWGEYGQASSNIGKLGAQIGRHPNGRGDSPAFVGELACCSRGPQDHNRVGKARTVVELRSTGAASMLPYDQVAAGQLTAQTPPRIGGLGGLTALCGLVIGAWFLMVFAQTTNVNSGGTVHISRYALWLLPLGLPLLATAAGWLRPRLPALLPVAGGLALLAYGAMFQPGQGEQYVTPSPQSALITTWLPELYRTAPEIFYERQTQLDGGVRGSAATASCHVILLHAESPEMPCPLSPEEAGAASGLFATGWHAAWIIRPGPLGLGEGGVFGAVPRP